MFYPDNCATGHHRACSNRQRAVDPNPRDDSRPGPPVAGRRRELVHYLHGLCSERAAPPLQPHVNLRRLRYPPDRTSAIGAGSLSDLFASVSGPTRSTPPAHRPSRRSPALQGFREDFRKGRDLRSSGGHIDRREQHGCGAFAGVDLDHSLAVSAP